MTMINRRSVDRTLVRENPTGDLRETVAVFYSQPPPSTHLHTVDSSLRGDVSQPRGRLSDVVPNSAGERAAKFYYFKRCSPK